LTAGQICTVEAARTINHSALGGAGANTVRGIPGVSDAYFWRWRYVQLSPYVQWVLKGPVGTVISPPRGFAISKL